MALAPLWQGAHMAFLGSLYMDTISCPYSYVQGAPRIAFAVCPRPERQSIEIISKSGVLELVSSSPYPVQALDW